MRPLPSHARSRNGSIEVVCDRVESPREATGACDHFRKEGEALCSPTSDEQSCLAGLPGSLFGWLATAGVSLRCRWTGTPGSPPQPRTHLPQRQSRPPPTDEPPAAVLDASRVPDPPRPAVEPRAFGLPALAGDSAYRRSSLMIAGVPDAALRRVARVLWRLARGDSYNDQVGLPRFRGRERTWV